MKPRVIFGDPEALLVNHLKAEFATRPDFSPTVTTRFPVTPDGKGAVLALGATHLQVELEVGNADDYPVTERAQVRITCYADKDSRSDVKRLASLAQALVYSHDGDADVAGCSILVGRSDVITDPDTKNLMVWFLARVNLKATLLAS